jgi:26S proteasome regulatory subunit N3
LHRTATLRQDEPALEVLINAVLRNFLYFKQYDQAEKFRAKVTWPERSSGAQLCRYLYYLGRIRCVQLEYSDAKECLTHAERKAPPGAVAFRLALAKWLIVTRLLLGEVPQRSVFRERRLETGLRPYAALAVAVRAGDLNAFGAVAERHAALFAADGVALLMARLRRTVIRTGLRHLCAAYSRISLQDVALKLGLPSAEDAQFVVAKAIRDGAVEGRLDAAQGCLLCPQGGDTYASGEPAAEFHARITFCLDLHNEAVRGMRYPADAHKSTALESAEQRKERQALEAELAQAMEDGDGDDDMF